MATQPWPIVATSSPSTPVQQNTARRGLYIKNYLYAPGTLNQQTTTIYVAFGVPATLGTNGELELIPGAEYQFGGPLPPRVGNLPKGFILPGCPTEYVSVIATGDTYGAILEQ